MNFLRLTKAWFFIVCLSSTWAHAQEKHWVSYAATEHIVDGVSDTLKLAFTIEDGYHIQANRPGDPLLIPSELSFEWPPGFLLDTLLYPPAHAFEIAGAEAPLQVYSDDILIGVALELRKELIPGRYTISGQLRYQACDSTKCYFPRELPLKLHLRAIN